MEYISEETLHNIGLAIQGMMRGVAVSKVRKIAESCTNFKIGKTGERLEERRNQPDYKDTYMHIKEIYTSKNAEEVYKMEADLIHQFILNSKCDNQKEGFLSQSDKMKNSDVYRVYVVWNDK